MTTHAAVRGRAQSLHLPHLPVAFDLIPVVLVVAPDDKSWRPLMWKMKTVIRGRHLIAALLLPCFQVVTLSTAQ